MNAAEPQKQLASALGRIPSGLFVLTARRQGRETGMLVSWVQQCAFEPPHLSLAIRRDRDIINWLTPDFPFTLNILDASQTDMIVHFGKGFALDEPAFTGLEISNPDEGGPVLTEALAYLLCRVASRCPAGDHELVLSRIVSGQVLSEGQPMIHIRKSGFHY
jgi:flavin reductase (DIM6/NTAB) family NADH-FMN oxidoreductase RutF